MRKVLARLYAALAFALVVGIMGVLNASAVLARDNLAAVTVLVTAAVWIPLHLIPAARQRRR
ncbi:hypothetical protein ACGFI9_01465 [Micromonospora sp. NPDC048930]|uniref:hypothetical protein n=1 Tax=Micromonospora sp. NPDC048930 TaxID=3364261 RepID=UPI00371B225F